MSYPLAAQPYSQSHLTNTGYRSDCSGYVSQTFTSTPGFHGLGGGHIAVWPALISAAEDTGFCFPDVEIDDDPDCWYYPGPEVAHSGHW